MKRRKREGRRSFAAAGAVGPAVGAWLRDYDAQHHAPQGPFAAELGREALEALSRRRETPQEHFDRLVRLGWVNRQGEVTRLLGGDAEPEPDSEPRQAAQAKKNNKPQRRK